MCWEICNHLKTPLVSTGMRMCDKLVSGAQNSVQSPKALAVLKLELSLEQLELILGMRLKQLAFLL